MLELIKTRLTVIKANKSYVDGKCEDADDARQVADWSAAILHCINAIQVGYNSLYWFAYKYDSGDPDYLLWYFLNNFTIAEAEVTWKDIVSAWIDADITGRLWTVATIDELRKEVWNEPFEGLLIKAGAKPA